MIEIVAAARFCTNAFFEVSEGDSAQGGREPLYTSLCPPPEQKTACKSHGCRACRSNQKRLFDNLSDLVHLDIASSDDEVVVSYIARKYAKCARAGESKFGRIGVMPAWYQLKFSNIPDELLSA